MNLSKYTVHKYEFIAVLVFIFACSFYYHNVQVQADTMPSGFTGYYSDEDNNGTVDTLTITVAGSLPLITCNALAIDFGYLGRSVGGTIGDATSCDLDTGVIVFPITEANTNVTGSTLPVQLGRFALNGEISNNFGTLGLVSFVSIDDNANPVVVSVSPSLDESDVLIDSDIVINFSESMATDSLNNSNFFYNSEAIDSTPVWQGNKQISFTNNTFLAGDNITLTIGDGVTDASPANNPLHCTGSCYSWSFVTQNTEGSPEPDPEPSPVVTRRRRGGSYINIYMAQQSAIVNNSNLFSKENEIPSIRTEEDLPVIKNSSGIYLLGGRGEVGLKPKYDSWLFDPETNSTRLLGYSVPVGGYPKGIYFNDKIYLVGGGTDSKNDSSPAFSSVYSSINGINWNFVKEAPFAPRVHHGAVVFKDNIYVLGGQDSKGKNLNDVWRSANGEDWVLVSEKASWNSGKIQMTQVLNDKLYISVSDNISPDQIWSTFDGVNWTREVDAPFGVRVNYSSIVFNDKLYIIGGKENILSQYKNDVWSFDGTAWNQIATTTEFSPREALSSFVSDNKIYIFGGRSSTIRGFTNYNDIWSSSDGVNWTQINLSINNISTRGFSSIVVIP